MYVYSLSKPTIYFKTEQNCSSSIFSLIDISILSDFEQQIILSLCSVGAI